MKLNKLNYKNEQLERRLAINDRSKEIEDVVQNLSSMMLSGMRNNPQITIEQRNLIQSLFGDVATEGYREHIKILEKKLDEKTKEWIRLKNSHLKHKKKMVKSKYHTNDLSSYIKNDNDNKLEEDLTANDDINMFLWELNAFEDISTENKHENHNTNKFRIASSTERVS